MNKSSQKDVLIIVRHGEPALSRDKRLNWRGFKYWWMLYDEGGLKQGQEAPKIIKRLAKQSDLIISSTLRRAIETANLAKKGAPDKLSDLLVEAPLPPPNLGYFRFTPRVWGVLARISWLLGFSGGGESFRQARKRADKAAELLSQEAKGGKFIMVTAHGWFNRMIRRGLYKRGFVCTEDHGDLHWSYRRFERNTKIGEENG